MFKVQITVVKLGCSSLPLPRRAPVAPGPLQANMIYEPGRSLNFLPELEQRSAVGRGTCAASQLTLLRGPKVPSQTPSPGRKNETARTRVQRCIEVGTRGERES